MGRAKDIKNVTQNQQKAALCAYFLSRLDVRGHERLGFASEVEAFRSIAEKTSINRNTVSRQRDYFDGVTDSSRVGRAPPLRPKWLEKIMETYQRYTDDELETECKTILQQTGDFVSDNPPGIDTTKDIKDITKKQRGAALCAYFLSRVDKGCERLGFSTLTKAFKAIEEKTSISQRTINWNRWSFDGVIDNGRKGRSPPLRPEYLQTIMKTYQSYTDDELEEACKAILQRIRDPVSDDLPGIGTTEDTKDVPQGKQDAALFAYFLSRLDTNGHIRLGFSTAGEAFAVIAEKTSIRPNTVKHHRNSFDGVIDNSRIGHPPPLSPKWLEKIVETYQSSTDDELEEACKGILQRIGDPVGDDLPSIEAAKNIKDVTKKQRDAALCAYFLSRVDKGCERLGFATLTKAFKAIEEKTSISRYTAGSHRWSFDGVIDNGRKGRSPPLRPEYLQTIMKTYQSYTDDELETECKTILQRIRDPVSDDLPGIGTTEDTKDVPQGKQDARLSGHFLSRVDGGCERLGFSTLEAAFKAIAEKTSTNHFTVKSGYVRYYYRVSNRLVSPSLNDTSPIPRWVKTIKETYQSYTDDELETECKTILFGATTPRLDSLPQQSRNLILCGAPGTGKSHKAESFVDCQKGHLHRTVFHADFQNADFVGTIKPKMKGSDIGYSFEEGPLVTALTDAFRHKNEPVVLLIEELNRGNAAAIFGEMFQLLDRGDEGRSKYPIRVAGAIQEKLSSYEEIGQTGRLSFPSNLYIVATMNSSDQGVYPLDTAFRRRWALEYMPIDFKKAKKANPMYSQPKITIEKKQYSWCDFAESINEALLKIEHISEDRLLGPFFISPEELKLDDSKFKEMISGKVLIYLWDDVLKHEGRESIFAGAIKSFNDLQKGFNGGKKEVFAATVMEKLDELTKPGQADDEETELDTAATSDDDETDS